MLFLGALEKIMGCLKITYNTKNQPLFWSAGKFSKPLKIDVNWLDYGARMYDAELGRFHTKDRFAEKYFDFTPYQYGANNPIKYIDVNGDSLWINYGKSRILYEDGKLYNSDGTAYNGKGVKKNGELKGFLKKTVNALNTIGEGTEGNQLISELQSSESNIDIEEGDGNSNNYKPDDLRSAINGTGTGGVVVWSGKDVNVIGQSRPGFIALAHELAHGQDATRGTMNSQFWFSVGSGSDRSSVYKVEQFATFVENKIRAEHNQPLRTHYQPGYNNSRILLNGTSKSLFYPIDYQQNAFMNRFNNWYESLKHKL